MHLVQILGLLRSHAKNHSLKPRLLPAGFFYDILSKMNNKYILLVEDDKFLQQLYLELLISEGFHATSSGDGIEALKLIKSKSWDLILLDVMLPGLDGFQIMDELEKSDKDKISKIVYLTNLDGNDDDLKKLKKAQNYLIKSDMSPPEFVEKVKALLSQ